MTSYVLTAVACLSGTLHITLLKQALIVELVTRNARRLDVTEV